MKNVLMQIFVLLPIAALETISSGIIALSIGALIINGLNNGFNGEMLAMLIGGIVVIVIGLGILIGLFFLDRKIRGFDDEVFTQLFYFASLPFRFFLQLIAILFAVISAINDSVVDSDWEYSADTVGESITFVLFSCTFDTALGHRIRERRVNASPKKRNLLMQILVLFPIAAIQCALSCVFFFVIIPLWADGDGNPLLMLLYPYLILCALALFSGISTNLRGHASSGKYFVNAHRYVRKKNSNAPYLTNEEIQEVLIDTYNNNPNASPPEIPGYKYKSGGWRTFVRPIAILCFLSSSFLVIPQFISIIIALFAPSDPYERVFSWYGEVDYSYCSFVFFQKLLHFYFGIVIQDY